MASRAAAASSSPNSGLAIGSVGRSTVIIRAPLQGGDRVGLADGRTPLGQLTQAIGKRSLSDEADLLTRSADIREPTRQTIDLPRRMELRLDVIRAGHTLNRVPQVQQRGFRSRRDV